MESWNVWHAWNRLPGVVEELHTAAMLNMFCREGRKVGLTLGAYFEPVNEGAIWVERSNARLTPAGEVFRLFRAHHGNELIRVVNMSPQTAAALEISLRDMREIVQAEGTLLSSTDFLPESTFRRSRLPIRVAGRRMVVTVPKHSVAMLCIGL